LRLGAIEAAGANLKRFYRIAGRVARFNVPFRCMTHVAD
jgi:hypothetical protein